MNRSKFGLLCVAFALTVVPVANAQEGSRPQVSAPAVIAQAPATGEARPKREATPAMRAARERQKVCAKNWQAEKAAGKTAGQKWPQYWSACNKKLKATTGA